jgi:hypothetical protein
MYTIWLCDGHRTEKLIAQRRGEYRAQPHTTIQISPMGGSRHFFIKSGRYAQVMCLKRGDTWGVIVD